MASTGEEMQSGRTGQRVRFVLRAALTTQQEQTCWELQNSAWPSQKLVLNVMSPQEILHGNWV